ncbi:hypothetical protein GIB67_028648 [Kingdonia uniflora]|uniref:Uncharacterized protein n=1 Tax=Kingdonia uniflora TaxID=39325 RepID=A0A7J7KZR1_9MAGN|nr:hypothetical protein GIB67_028648 [Kingdonia uniflora]
MVLEERIASEMLRLKLKYFGDHSLEMAIPTPIPPTYQGLSGEETVEAEEDFYYKWRFHAFILTGEERWACLRTLTNDRVKNVPVELVFKMGSSSVNEASTSGRTNESDNEEEVELEQFLGIPGRTWNDNIIWVNGNCLQRDDEELLDLWFRTVKQSVKSKVERKESLLDKVAEEETELELVLEGLGLSRKKRVDSEKVAKEQSATVDDLKEVEERARLAVLHREEDTSKMVAHLIKGIWLGIAEEKSELKKANVKLEKELARSWADALKEVRQLKASHAVAIGLGRHLILKGYSEEEVDAIKVDTYVEVEDKEEAEAVGIADDLDGISRQTVLDNQGDDINVPEGGSEKTVSEMSLKINDLESGLARERETFNALLSAQAELQGHVQKGNANLRECQHKLDTALIREKVLEGEIKAKESLLKRKGELLKDMPAREELNAEIGRLRARVVDLEAIKLAESERYINKLEENVIYHAKVDAEMIELKNEYARLDSCLERLRVRFAIMVIPDVSRSGLLKAIITYFIEEVKRLESQNEIPCPKLYWIRDTFVELR